MSRGSSVVPIGSPIPLLACLAAQVRCIRIGRRLKWVAALAVLLCAWSNVRAQQNAFISATGTFSAAGQFSDFLFTTNILGSPSTLTLRTQAYSGGTNFAGQTIAAGGIDATLNLFNGSNTSIAFNDDINTAGNLWDSQIIVNNPGNFSDYRLRLGSNNRGDGHWSTDIGISGSGLTLSGMRLNGINNSASSTLNSLAIGGTAGETVITLSSATINMTGGFSISNASFEDLGGMLMAGSMFLGGALGPGSVLQNSGSTILAGDLSSQGGNNYGMNYSLNGGTLQVGGSEYLSTSSLTASNFTQSAGFHSIGGLLAIGTGNAGKAASFNIGGGTLLSGQLNVGDGSGAGVLNQSGGFVSTGYTFIGPGLFTPATFNQTGGTFHASQSITVGGGTVSTWTIGSFATASTGSYLLIRSNATVTLNGGTLSTPYVSLQGGTIIFSSGTLNLTGIGFDVGPLGLFGNVVNIVPSHVLSVSGTTTIETNSTLQVNSTIFSTGALVNNGGQLVFPSGTIQITASPVQIGSAGSFGSTLQLSPGQNIIDTYPSSPSVVNSAGLLYLTGGTFSAAAGVNNNTGGDIQLTSTPSTLAGGTLTNSGLVTGTGRVFNALSNQPGGEVRVNANDDLRFLGSANSNAGKINLINGGIVEFVSGLTNSGLITGNGNILSSGTVNNSGTITFTGGNNTFQAALVNQSAGKVIVTGGSTSTFYNPVTNNAGSEFRVSTGSTAVFLGNVSGTGSFSGQGIKIFEAGGSLGPIDTLTGSSIVSANATLTAARVREASLEVDGAAQISPDGSNSGASKLAALNIAGTTGNWSGKLNLSNNDLIIDYSATSPLADVKDQIHSGYNAGAWNGNGITTGMGDSTHALGYAENSILGYSTFDGLPVDGTTVLVKFTFAGDSNLDGEVDLKDLYVLASHYKTPADLWTSGDFNYDGKVDVKDLTLLAINWQAGVGSPLGTPLGSVLSSLGLPTIHVPEPSGFGIGLLFSAVLRRRRSWS